MCNLYGMIKNVELMVLSKNSKYTLRKFVYFKIFMCSQMFYKIQFHNINKYFRENQE